MTVGSIVHELFQIVLGRRLTTRDQIQAVCDEMLADGEMAYTLYGSSMKTSEARTEFNGFLDKIYDFMQQYVEGKTPAEKIVCSTQILSNYELILINFVCFYCRKIILRERLTASRILRRIFGYPDWASKAKSMYPSK